MEIGDKMPEFEAVDGGEAIFSSKELEGQPCVIYFYPKDETYGCTEQACEFRDRIDEFDRAGAIIVGISSDTSSSHAHFANRHLLPYTLLSDPKKKLRKLFGVKNEFLFLPGRETFIFNKEAILIGKYRSNINFKKHAEEAIRALKESA